MRNAANEIFETDRFDHLKTINLTTGNRNQAFVLAPPAAGAQRQRYVSEKNFSLGELCVLKLLRELIDCHNGSLVLIDELELALHPRAQVGLLTYLNQIAAQKALTIIVSTHSVTLLKTAPRAKIMFLERGSVETRVIQGCFPAYALGNLALTEERVPDIVLYVEDESARAVLDGLKKLMIAARYSAATDVFPTVEVIPVGDFKNVVRFFDKNRAMLPNHVKQWMVLDADVQLESNQIMAASSNNPMRDAFHRHESSIRYLPWTPEVGLFEYLEASRIEVQDTLRRRHSNAYISLPSALFSIQSRSGAQFRSQCKSAIRQITTNICDSVPNLREETLRDELFLLFAEWYFNTHAAQARQFLGPLISV